MKVKIISRILGMFRGVYLAFKEASAETKMAVGFTTAKCHYITDNGVWEMNGTYSKDRRYFRPKGIDRLWRVSGKYPLNGSDTILYCYDHNVNTIKMGDPPKPLNTELKKSLEDRRKDLLKQIDMLEDPVARDQALDSISYADYNIPGADILSSYGLELMDNVDMKFIQGVSRSKIILLLIIGILMGFIIGSILSSVVILALVSGG